MIIFNKYINDDYIDSNNQFDWNQIEEDYRILDNSIDVILIDFVSAEISNNDILILENNFNELNRFVREKDINGVIKTICDNYTFLSNNMVKSNKLERIKSNILYLGYYLKNEMKEEAIIVMNEIEFDYSELMTDKDYLEEN